MIPLMPGAEGIAGTAGTAYEGEGCEDGGPCHPAGGCISIGMEGISWAGPAGNGIKGAGGAYLGSGTIVAFMPGVGDGTKVRLLLPPVTMGFCKPFSPGLYAER